MSSIKSRKYNNNSSKYSPTRKYKVSDISDCRQNDSFCNASGVLCDTTVIKLQSFIPANQGNTDEVAGPLILEKISEQYNKLPSYKIIMNIDDVVGGNGSEVDAIETKYNFHSHPEAAYIAHNCELGWPSRDDYITFLDGFFKYDTTFHIIASQEGVYILKINPCAITRLKEFYKLQKDKEKFIDNVDYWADEYINISKIGFKRKNGVKAPKTGQLIKSPREYVQFVNNVICNKIKCKENVLELNVPMFDIEFIDWKNASKKPFVFTVNKNKNGKCNL
jgi:hypothetical protein